MRSANQAAPWPAPKRCARLFADFIGAALAIALAGCGTTGTLNANLASTPVPPQKARLTITRANALLYAGAAATITLNGGKVADLAPGGSAIFDIPAGDNVLAASAWSYPGTFSVKLAAKAEERYAVEVSPREASFLPGMVLGVVGAAIDASVNENAGAFQMRFVEAEKVGAFGVGGDRAFGERSLGLSEGAQTFKLGSENHDDGDYIEPIKNLSLATAEILNSFIAATGGTVFSDGKVTVNFLTQRYDDGDTRERDRVSGGGRDTETKENETRKTEDRIEFTVLEALSRLDFAGGNLYVKRALALTDADSIEQLAGEIKIAEDYGRYLANKPVIDALIGLDPNSAFAAGWLVTLLRAEEMGITALNRTDFHGGIASFLKGFDLTRFGAAANDNAALTGGALASAAA